MTPPTPLEKFKAKLVASRDVQTALKSALQQSKAKDLDEVWGLLMRLHACSQPRNHWHADEIWSEKTGEVFEGLGQYWQCGSKLCPFCIVRVAQRHRRQVREALERQVLYPGERYYFVTFTMPNPRRDLLANRSIINRAWSMFRKRKMCVDLIRGGVKAEEFTVGAFGYHYHLHLIIKSKFLRYNDVRRLWTDCLEKVFTENNIAYDPHTTDGLQYTHIAPLGDKEKAVQEICKYITKSDSWLKVPQSELIAIAKIRRWHRMFELFGTFAPKSKRTPIVQTRDFTDGTDTDESTYWRDICNEFGVRRYAEILEAEIEATRNVRNEQLRFKYPNVQIRSCDELL